MPFKLLQNETLATGLKRIVEEQLSVAITQLEAPQDLNLSIYEARKYLKKARAVLRLLSPQLGPIYIEENRRLRDVARRFGSLRDTHVSLELLKKFAERYKRKSVLNPQRQLLAAKRNNLLHERDWELLLAESRESLLATRKRMEDWPLLHVTEESLQAEIRQTEKQSCHAFEKAKKTRLAEDFHELRKSVKRQLNQARLLNPALVDELKKLAALLGDHHNLAVLLTSVENTSARFRAMVRCQMKDLETGILTAELPHVSRVFW